MQPHGVHIMLRDPRGQKGAKRKAVFEKERNTKKEMGESMLSK